MMEFILDSCIVILVIAFTATVLVFLCQICRAMIRGL